MAQLLGISWAWQTVFKRKFRYLFTIPGVCDDGIFSWPSLTAGRPSIKFDAITVPHLQETISFPSRPSFDPINITLYDISSNNPVWNWILQIYNPNFGLYTKSNTHKKLCRIFTLDGCGNPLDVWILEGAYCESANFGSLDMSSSDVVTVDISIRYDRAYKN